MLHGLVTGHCFSRAIYVAAKLGIAGLRKHGPSLHRLMLFLVSAKIFAEGDAGRFRLAPMGECLRSDVPGFQRPHALLLAGPLQPRAWSVVERERVPPCQ